MLSEKKSPISFLIPSLMPHDLLPVMSNQLSDPVATFSIAAFDPETTSLGVAVPLKFPAAGAVMPWVRGLLRNSHPVFRKHKFRSWCI
jgi:hypothetical protein